MQESQQCRQHERIEDTQKIQKAGKSKNNQWLQTGAHAFMKLPGQFGSSVNAEFIPCEFKNLIDFISVMCANTKDSGDDMRHKCKQN